MFRSVAAPVCAALAAGCVTTGTYNAKVAELEGATAQHDKAAAEREAALQKQIDSLQSQVKDVESKKADVEKQLAAVTAERDAIHKQLDDSTALAAELKKRLEKLGQNVDKLTSEKGQLAGALTDMKGKLDELRKQKETADALAATFRNLVQKLKGMIDSGQLKVVIRDGRMLIALPNDVLFDSGHIDLKPDAKLTLTKVAQVLSSIGERHFLVAGHTDNVPIHTARFASNWELSTGRAVEVTKFLVSQGMKPEVLAAAGYGEFDPIAPNDTTEHRALNRRIEIVLQPNLSELPSLEGVIATSKN